MPLFAQRSYELEMMDYPITNRADIFQNFEEILFINRYLGGAEHTFNALQKMLAPYKGQTLTIADIGAGGGDTLAYIWKRKRQLGCEVKLVGVDLMPEAIDFAKQKFPEVPIQWVCEDFETWLPTQKPDIVLCGLFCHHLTDEQMVKFLRLAYQNTRIGFIINDLHRHFLAYYSIKWLTRLFAKSPLTRNDAPLSVLRGFSRKELTHFFQQAQIDTYKITWKWAFRFLCMAQKNKNI
ncbi:MAG: methyltransferase domain-containing protein [Bacteroidetes bacterium]|nr:MAG: methyltransferase domain-containing protein [Bacteroidota bacterium]